MRGRRIPHLQIAILVVYAMLVVFAFSLILALPPSALILIPFLGGIAIFLFLLGLEQVKRKSAPSIKEEELTQLCTKCGTELPLGAKFCDNCGASQQQ